MRYRVDPRREARAFYDAVFGALGSSGINVTAISQGSSERNISMVIAEDDAAKAVRALHLAFKLHEAPAGAAH